MKLGELLLEEKLVQPAQLEEALETQVIHGGRLGTNLVELGFLKEADLARVLGRQHNMPFASGQMIPDPTAMGIADRQFYDDKDVLPMRVEPTRITMVVLGPTAVEAIEALAFKEGKRVVPVVIPEFRMNQLLRLHAKAFRPLRPIDMNTLRPTKEQAAVTRTPQAGEVSELINEDDFAAIYASAAAVADEEEVLEGAVVVDEPMTAAPVVRPPRPVVVAEPMPPPIAFGEAQKELQASSNREDIARTVLQFASSKFRRSLLLNVQGQLVTGWHGLGKGVSERAVRRIGVSLKEANTFQLVAKLQSHFVGPVKKTPGMSTFYELLGGAFPTTAVILPLLVRGKVVHMLYLDNGPSQITPPDVGELLIVSQSVTRSYEAIIRERKARR